MYTIFDPSVSVLTFLSNKKNCAVNYKFKLEEWSELKKKMIKSKIVVTFVFPFVKLQIQFCVYYIHDFLKIINLVDFPFFFLRFINLFNTKLKVNWITVFVNIDLNAVCYCVC